MTICVSVRVAEGLVMAADSATTVHGSIGNNPQKQLLQSFQYATKVAQVGDLPMGVMTWGLGSIASRSIQSLVMEFEFDYSIKGKFKVEKVAADLLRFITGKYDTAYPTPTGDHTLGLFVGGFSDGEFLSTQLYVELPTKRAWQPLRPDVPGVGPTFGANWFGASDALQRLILGWDQGSIDKLIARGADQKIIQAWISALEPELPLIFDGMPLQDAIDFAIWAATVVIGRWRFGFGPAIVGGDVDIAVIRPRSFQWAQRKRWSVKDDEGRRIAIEAGPAQGAERNVVSRVPGDGEPSEPAGQVAQPGPAAKRPRNRSKPVHTPRGRRT